MRRLAARPAGVAVLALVGLLAWPAAPAGAHATLVASSPAADSVLTALPAQVVLTFSEKVTPVSGRVQVLAPDGSRVDAGSPRASGARLAIVLRPGSARGSYLVSYRVVSADSHPIGGAFVFSVGAPTTPPGDTSAAGSSSPAAAIGLASVRYLSYLALIVLVGSLVALALLWPARLPRGGPLWLLYGSGVALAVLTLAELALQVPYVAGGGPAGAEEVRAVLASSYGSAHAIRLGVLAAVLFVARPALRGRPGWSSDRVLLVVLGLGGLATWPMAGHPSVTAVPELTVIADMVHLGAMSFWLGGLVMLIAFLLPRANAGELAAIVPVWSRWATWAVVALLLTGVVQAVAEVGAIGALVSTTYGRLLLAKLALVGLVLLVAAGSRRLVAPIAAGADTASGAGAGAGAGAGSDHAAGRLKRILIAESAGAAVVLALAAALVQTPPARTAGSAVPAVQSAVLRDELFTLSVDLEPARVGVNELHLYASDPTGKPADVKAWTVRAQLTAQGVEPVDAAVLRITADHAIGQITLSAAGAWRFTFTLRTSDTDQASVATEFEVRP